MGKKERILAWLDQIDQKEREFAGKLSDEQRQKTGTLEHWEPKEVLAHSAGWLQRTLDNIELARGGVEPVKYENFLELNDQDFAAYSKLTWEEASKRSMDTREALRRLLDELSEADLDSTDFPPAETKRPLWVRITGNAIEHPITHLDLLFQEIGEEESIADFQKNVFNELIEMDPDNPEWQGVMRYNLACQDALRGRKDQALAGLRLALELNPGLTEWSKEDPDFNSLREDRDYLAIYG